MAISKQYLQLFDVKPWSHHHQKATIERAPTTVTPPPRHTTPRYGLGRLLRRGLTGGPPRPSKARLSVFLSFKQMREKLCYDIISTSFLLSIIK